LLPAGRQVCYFSLDEQRNRRFMNSYLSNKICELKVNNKIETFFKRCGYTVAAGWQVSRIHTNSVLPYFTKQTFSLPKRTYGLPVHRSGLVKTNSTIQPIGNNTRFYYRTIEPIFR
ncbi:hypothetical protein Q4Q35_07310, partial [Flavivirga aquimarina]